MDDELVKARNFARTVRYSEDTLTADESIQIENTEIDAFFSLNSIHKSNLIRPFCPAPKMKEAPSKRERFSCSIDTSIGKAPGWVL